MKIGEKLKNGATVLAFKEVGGLPFSGGPIATNAPTPRNVVLAFTNENAATPFVTWRYNDNGDTYWGHYFKTADEAWKEFNERW